ncbi:hypothetical protein QEW_1728 [Clostridioides difficile CD160]|nr:hypothetical protein QEW_1728 [Clostridioides difficile CD160]
MNKTEFLEILKDYLKKDFSESEVNDILRDYEEYFVDGIIEGKSDMEIIASLGSPKSIARELILQTKEKDTEEEKIINTDVLNDKFSKFKSDMKKGYSILKDEAKEKYNKSKENINDKLTPSIEESVGGLSRQVIKALLVVLSLFLIIPAFAFICAVISVAIGLVCTLIAFVISIPFVIKFITMVPDVTMFCIFATIGFVGLEILAWQILLFVIKLGKQLLGSYINWIKRKNIYINANEKMEKRNKEILREEDLDKDIDEDSYSDDYYNIKEESIKKTDDYDDNINFEAMYKDLEDIDDKKGEDKHE